MAKKRKGQMKKRAASTAKKKPSVSKKKRSGVIRNSISIPADVKSQMDKVEESVNWSALAVRAFQDKLAEISELQEIKTMEDVVERLRKSKRDHASERYKEGEEAGRHWANNDAEAHELRRLEDFCQSLWSENGWDDYFSDPEGSYGTSQGLALTMLDIDLRMTGEHPRAAAEDFWECAVGSEELDNDFLKGFSEAAIGVWQEVKGQL